MKATGFTGVATVLGRDRDVHYGQEALTIGDLTMGEAQMIVTILEKLQAGKGKSTGAQPPISPAMLAGMAAAASGAKVDAPSEPEEKAEAKTEPAPKAEPPKTTRRRRRSTKAEEPKPEPEPEASPEPEDDVPPHDPETGEVLEDDEDEAAAEREAIQALEAEEEARIAAEEKAKAEAEAKAKAKAEADAKSKSKGKGQTNGAKTAADDDVPDAIKKAKHLRNVIAFLVEDRNITDADSIVAWCQANAEQIGVVKRVGPKLPDRVDRALKIMSN